MRHIYKGDQQKMSGVFFKALTSSKIFINSQKGLTDHSEFYVPFPGVNGAEIRGTKLQYVMRIQFQGIYIFFDIDPKSRTINHMEYELFNPFSGDDADSDFLTFMMLAWG